MANVKGSKKKSAVKKSVTSKDLKAITNKSAKKTTGSTKKTTTKKTISSTEKKTNTIQKSGAGTKKRTTTNITNHKEEAVIHVKKRENSIKKEGNSSTVSNSKKVSTNEKVKKSQPSNTKKEPILSRKMKIVFLVVTCICIIVLIGEGIFFSLHHQKLVNSSVYYDSLNAIITDNKDIVAVGSSDFQTSKYNKYTGGSERGKLIKYDSSGKILFEKAFDKGINSTFSSIIAIEDGYIIVGSGQFSEKEVAEGAREAFILKCDKEGNFIWEKYYQVVTNTNFNKVIMVEDGYIAVGQSIYANMEMGNHTTGGGIIVKYDFDGNEIWHNNHGGMKSGNFYDVVEVNGSLYVVGKDGSDSGNLVKFSRDGKYQWHKNYSYTDGIGLTGLTYFDNSLYVVGSKKILPDGIGDEDEHNTTNTDALLIKYDLEGNIIFEKTFGGSSFERYNSIISRANHLYVVGHTTSNDAGLKVSDNTELMTGIIVSYDKNGNITKKEALGGSNNDNLTDIYTDGASLFVSGYSNSKDGNIKSDKSNGKDYVGKMIKLDFKFRTMLLG